MIFLYLDTSKVAGLEQKEAKRDFVLKVLIIIYYYSSHSDIPSSACSKISFNPSVLTTQC